MTLHPVAKGRPKGALNYATRELKQALQRFFSSPEYRQSVEARIIAGTAPTVEIYLLQMLYGKPREVVDVHVGVEVEELSTLSAAELVLRAENLMTKVREIEELERQIPPEYRIIDTVAVTTTTTAEAPSDDDAKSV